MLPKKALGFLLLLCTTSFTIFQCYKLMSPVGTEEQEELMLVNNNTATNDLDRLSAARRISRPATKNDHDTKEKKLRTSAINQANEKKAPTQSTAAAAAAAANNNSTILLLQLLQQNTPSVTEVEASLLKEQNKIHGDTIDSNLKKKVHSLAQTYALTYAIIHEFQKRGMLVALVSGSHLGALRHHGVIPFEEKDVDLALFSNDEAQIKSALRAALETQPELHLQVSESNFGYQIDPSQSTLKTYIDVWLFENDPSNPRGTKCVGHRGPRENCQTWYRHFHAKDPPTYRYDAWYPFRMVMFGTERAPVPATNVPIESFPFDDGGPNFWNTTCGPDRRWVRTKWVNVGMKERNCSHKYGTYPFVFLKEGGVEQLRQGSTVIHEVVTGPKTPMK